MSPARGSRSLSAENQQFASAEIVAALSNAGTEVRLRLKTGEVIFARVVVTPLDSPPVVRVRPWGSRRIVDVDVSRIKTACIATVPWATAHRIAEEQRERFEKDGAQ